MEKNLTIDFFGSLKSMLNIYRLNPLEYSSLSLALLGDGVYDLALRYYVLSGGEGKINILHAKKSHFVRAKSQAKFIDSIINTLTDEELAVFKRGRNTKSKTVAKNASIIEYRKSTGFEALLGYLFLKEDFKRLNEIIVASIEFNRRNNE